MSRAGLPIAGVETWPAPDDPSRLTVEFDPSAPPPLPAGNQAAVERAWAGLLAQNPRMFDGKVLGVVGEDLRAGTIRCRLDSFKHLAVQDSVTTGVELLAVSAVIVAPDARGREHVFLGRRHPQTRIYGNLWEMGPSGGVPPPAVARSMDLGDLVAHLGEEMREEAGMALDPSTVKLLGFCRDHAAHSLDVLLRVEPGATIEKFHDPGAKHDWEYAEVRWQPLDALAAFDREHSHKIIAPTRAAFRLLGWVKD